MVEPLERRFHRFITAVRGTEAIDALLAGRNLENERRADYLLANRRVILELKELRTDTSPKVDKELDKHRERDDYPLIYGEVELQKVLRHLPDGAQINKRIYGSITRSIEDAVRSAEEQIANTAKLFQLDSAVGFLVILNEGIEILSPDVVVHRVSSLISRPRKEGKSPIDFVWLLFESHVTSDAHPCIVIEGASADQFSWFGAAVDELQNLWAKFNRAPLITLDVKKITDLAFESAAKSKKKTSETLTRQQLWERRYEAAPHLRKLTDEEVLAFGARAFERLTPHFLKGGPKLPLEQLEPLFVDWSDFLQEARHRGLDLKGFHAKT